MLANLDALLTALYVQVDDFLPKRRGPRHPPRITDSELVTLAVAQMFLAIPNDRKFLALARWRLGHLFPYLPKQPGYNKRLRALAPAIARVITHLAVTSATGSDCSTALRSRAANPAKPPGDPSSPAPPHMAGARVTRATSGGPGCTCCALRTGCRSRSNSPQRTPRTSRRRRAGPPCPARRVHRPRRQRLRRRGVRAAHGQPRRPLPAPRPQRRTSTKRLARPHSPMDRERHLDLQRPTHPRSPRRSHRPRRLRSRRHPNARARSRSHPQPTDQ